MSLSPSSPPISHLSPSSLLSLSLPPLRDDWAAIHPGHRFDDDVLTDDVQKMMANVRVCVGAECEGGALWILWISLYTAYMEATHSHEYTVDIPVHCYTLT
jgi:hypothetical protein